MPLLLENVRNISAVGLREAWAIFAATLSRARTACPCGRRQKVREIVRIKREGGGKEGGDLIIYRKQAVPHLSLSPSLAMAPHRRGSLAPRTRTFSSRSTRTDAMLHSEEAEGKERPFPCYYSLQPIHPSHNFF